MQALPSSVFSTLTGYALDMRLSLLTAALLSLCCGQSKAPVGPQNTDDAGKATSCDSLRPKVTSLYQQAATNEELPPNLHSEFIQSNLHMVMTDCHAAPKAVTPCLVNASTVAMIEEQCLSALDEAGEVEGKQFQKE